MEKTDKIAEIRTAVADVLRSSGCGCCANAEQLEAAKKVLGKLLGVEQYSDGSGYAFYKYCSDRDYVERMGQYVERMEQ